MAGTDASRGEIRPEALVQAFADFLPVWNRWMRTSLRESGLTPARARLLAVLAESGSVTMTTLSRLLRVSPRNVTTLVDALENDELVRRVQHPTDRRATNIELTEQGRALGRSLGSDHLHEASALFD